MSSKTISQLISKPFAKFSLGCFGLSTLALMARLYFEDTVYTSYTAIAMIVPVAAFLVGAIYMLLMILNETYGEHARSAKAIVALFGATHFLAFSALNVELNSLTGFAIFTSSFILVDMALDGLKSKASKD